MTNLFHRVIDLSTGIETQVPLTAEEIAEREEFLHDVLPTMQMEALRSQRNRLLAETDWVTLKAYSQGVAVPTEWATYQQALRDLPANTTDPANPTWPTKPS